MFYHRIQGNSSAMFSKLWNEQKMFPFLWVLIRPRASASPTPVHDRIISDVWLILDIFPRSRFVLTLPDFLKLWSLLLKNWFETTHNKNLSELQRSIVSPRALYKLNAVRNKWTFVEKEARHGYSSSAHWKWRVNQYLISFWNTKGSKNSESVQKREIQNRFEC